MVKRTKRGIKEVDIITDYQVAFNTDEGKRVLYDLLMACHFFQNMMCNNAGQLAYKEGQRSVTLRILDKLDTNAKDLLDLLEEAQKEEQKYDDAF